MIECKGGEPDLGSRRARQGGRDVRAEQTTPEYLRSLAKDMEARGLVDEANRIRRALDLGPPHIEVVVVRQPFTEDNQLDTPVITDYPVTRKGL